MQNNVLKGAAILLMSGIWIAPAFAQGGKSKTSTKEETVIIRKNKTDDKTVIEIKDGTVYVNGEAIVTVHDKDAATIRKKVVIEHGEGGSGSSGVQAFGFNSDDDKDFRDAPAPPSRRAMLGVMTDPKAGKVGAVVKSINPGSPAEAAGLREGDVITRVDGKSIKDAGALVNEISAQHDPGDKVTIIYEREGKERTTTATLDRAAPQMSMRSFRMTPEDFGGADMPNSFFRSFPFAAADDMTPAPKLGLSVEDRADGEGVRVLSAKPNAPAATAGIKEGDVITRVGDEKISSVEELQMSIRGIRPGETLKLEYQRAGKTAVAEVSLPKTVRRKDL